MSESQFLIIIILVVISYMLKNKITNFINSKLFYNSDFIFKSSYLSYFLVIILFVTLAFGMLLGTKTKKTFSNVSSGFKEVRSKGEDKPHPWFDIDTYW